MIAYLKGAVEEYHTDHLVLDVHGVGYRVEVSAQTLTAVKGGGTELKLLIYHHFTESDQRLFGFYTSGEKALFEQLITVKGVGPKLGLTIVSGLPAPELISAIQTQNAGLLSKVPGIGKKTAERIILELKDKLGSDQHVMQGENSGYTESGVFEEAGAALMALGFKQRETDVVLTGLLKDSPGISASELIKRALSHMNR
ncbi:MAG: Holliday junction branch migration protein RuvA [Bacteroidota bacterium]